MHLLPFTAILSHLPSYSPRPCPLPFLPTAPFPGSCLFAVFFDPLSLTKAIYVTMGLGLSVRAWWTHGGRGIQVKK